MTTSPPAAKREKGSGEKRRKRHLKKTLKNGRLNRRVRREVLGIGGREHAYDL